MTIQGAPDADYTELQGRPTLTVHLPSGGSGAQASSDDIYAKKCILVGWSLRETAGAVAVWELLDGTGGGGPLVATISLAANGESHESFTDDGPYCQQGLRADRISGSIRGAIYIKA